MLPQGVFPFTYDGTFWNKGISPIHTLNLIRGSAIYQRYIDMLLLLDNTRDYYHYKLPKVTLNICLLDQLPEEESDLPICVTECSPEDPFYIIPDGEYSRWDEIKQLTQKNVKKRQHVLYYRGNSEMATEIEDEVHSNPLFDIKGPRHGLQDEMLSQYSYLLDLPPSGPRLKHLFLAEATVIRIFPSPRIQFIDLFVKPGRDYIAVESTTCIRDLVKKLEHIIESNPRRFNRIRKEGYERVNMIKSEDVYKYIRKLIYKHC